jgi:hypothetical protein
MLSQALQALPHDTLGDRSREITLKLIYFVYECSYQMDLCLPVPSPIQACVRVTCLRHG